MLMLLIFWIVSILQGHLQACDGDADKQVSKNKVKVEQAAHAHNLLVLFMLIKKFIYIYLKSTINPLLAAVSV